MVNSRRLGADRESCKAARTTTRKPVPGYPVKCSIYQGLLVDSRGVGLVTIEKGPAWWTVGSTHAVRQPEISYRESIQSGLEP